jgi:hypothetical protein
LLGFSSSVKRRRASVDQESKERLRLDRRLIGRRGHIGREELERALRELPDVAGKAEPLVVEDRSASSGSEGREPKA